MIEKINFYFDFLNILFPLFFNYRFKKVYTNLIIIFFIMDG
ncbi:MAG: hypothetical protein BAJALOKI3v1_840002 [Promethearchaeota archaeon]|nr:MAG: hypothetical protein BAJALOKI3v1_840002 [Candidatus Lokiarchaeota archaeon]